MLELIKACYEIRALRGRLGLGLPMSAADSAALAVLERLFGPPGGVGVARRLETRVPVLFKSTFGKTASGRLTDLSAGGAFVETELPLAIGDTTTLRIRDERTLREYHFSAVCVRANRRGMGLRLVGIPVECRYLPIPAEMREAA
jgi:hypothetical protein